VNRDEQRSDKATRVQYNGQKKKKNKCKENERTGSRKGKYQDKATNNKQKKKHKSEK